MQIEKTEQAMMKKSLEKQSQFNYSVNVSD